MEACYYQPAKDNYTFDSRTYRLRTLYTILFLFLLPVLVLRLKVRARANPEYGKRIAERFARVPERPGNKPCVWVHAVSVGEVIAATPIVKQLQEQHSDWDFVVTTTTPTGSERVHAAFGDSVLHYYLPYDIPSFIQRFITQLKPSIFVTVETELWPNTIAVCKQNKVPVLLANGRLSAKSAKSYSKVYWLTKAMLERIDMLAVQAPADAKRFKLLGAHPDKVKVLGSVKFDVVVDETVKARSADLKDQLGLAGKKVAVFASTHPGEDELILPMIKRLSLLDESFVGVVVPRHLERFPVVKSLAEKFGIDYISLSDAQLLPDATPLIIGDTMGDMLALYGVADIAFVGGSLVHHGGHNYLEAAAWKLPIITGLSCFNFQTIAQQLKRSGALFIGGDAVAIEHKLEHWLDAERADEFEQMGTKAFQVCENNKGALPKLVETIEAVLI